MTTRAELPRQAKSEYDELLLLLEHCLPLPLRQIWHKSPDNIEPLLVKGGITLPVGFLSKALKTNHSNIRCWGRNKYQRKTWYCFDLQSKKLKYDAPKMQNRLLQEFPSIPENHFQSFQLMYLKKYMKSNDDNDTPSNPLPNSMTPSPSSPALAPTNINPLHVLPLTPDSSTPANPS